MVNRTWPGWAIPALALGLAGALLYGFNEHQLRSASLIKLETNYQSAFHGMVYDIDGMQDALASAQVTTSPSMVSEKLHLAARYAANGQTNINRLPSVLSGSGEISGFLEHVISTADNLSGVHANGTKLTAPEQKAVRQLYAEATRLEKETRSLQSEFIHSPASFVSAGADVARSQPSTLTKRFWALDTLSKRSTAQSSLHMRAASAAGSTQGQSAAITSAQALVRARAFVGAAANVPATAVRLGPGFDTPGYLVTLRQRGRVRTSVGLALHAGQVLWMTSDESLAGPTRYTVSQGLSQADRFLQTHGYESVVLKSQAHYGNSGTYTYVPLTGFVARESRPILVKVNLGNGTVTGFDASSMIGANTPQISLQPTISAGQAQRSLSAGFTVRQTRLAILEPSGQQAILVYEFMGASGATAFEVSVNAHSGAVVSVDKLNKSELEKL